MPGDVFVGVCVHHRACQNLRPDIHQRGFTRPVGDNRSKFTFLSRRWVYISRLIFDLFPRHTCTSAIGLNQLVCIYLWKPAAVSLFTDSDAGVFFNHRACAHGPAHHCERLLLLTHRCCWINESAFARLPWSPAGMSSFLVNCAFHSPRETILRVNNHQPYLGVTITGTSSPIVKRLNRTVKTPAASPVYKLATWRPEGMAAIRPLELDVLSGSWKTTPLRAAHFPRLSGMEPTRLLSETRKRQICAFHYRGFREGNIRGDFHLRYQVHNEHWPFLILRLITNWPTLN